MGYSLPQSDLMDEEYYIVRGSGQVPEGPFARESLRVMAARGDFDENTSVLYQGEWYPYSRLPSPPPCPPTYRVWSIISVFCCFPFSIISVRQSYRVAELYASGRYAEAREASRSALRWNVFFSVVVLLLLLLCWFCFSFAYNVWQQGDADILYLLRSLTENQKG